MERGGSRPPAARSSEATSRRAASRSMGNRPAGHAPTMRPAGRQAQKSRPGPDTPTAATGRSMRAPPRYCDAPPGRMVPGSHFPRREICHRLCADGSHQGEVIPMVEVSIGELLLAFVAAMGIPSAIMGLIVWRFKGHIEAREEAQAEKAKAQQDLFSAHRAEYAGQHRPRRGPRPTPCSAATRTATWRRRSPTPQTSSTSRRIFSRSKASTPCSMSEGRE